MHIFDREKCINCYHEAIAWDEENHWEKIIKIYGEKYNHIEFMDIRFSKTKKGWVAHPNETLTKNPRKEKTKEYRRCDKWRGNNFRYDKEPTKVRKILNKKFRRNMKQHLNEELDVLNKDYKTYGWFTH